MNYVITGSIGHISKPIVKELIAAKHGVTVITSNNARVTDIEVLGAKAAVGSVEDKAFLTATFAGADAVYLMIPPTFTATDWLAHMRLVADNYVAAVKVSAIKKVVVLSSIGAHLRNGVGPVDGLGYLEEQLEKLNDVDALFLRPSYFYYNLFNQAGLVKNAGIFGANYMGSDEKLVLVDTADIAEVAAKALLNLDFKGHGHQYIASDEVSTDEIAKALGEAIGKQGTPWVLFTDEQALQGMLGAGLSETIATEYVEMGASLRNGLMQQHYWQNKPALGKLKLAEFAKQFAAAYSS